MYASKVIAAFAVVGFAVAATSSTASQCSQPTATISNQPAASSLGAACPTFTGDLVVDPSVAGILTLSGFEQIAGSLTVTGVSNLTSLIAPSLNSITDSMTLTGLTILSTLQFPELTSVGTINWQTLPELQTLTFTTGVTKASSLTITDTQLSSLDGINLNTVDTMAISDNRFLTNITTNIANVTKSLDIDSNGQHLMVALPNLESSAGDLTFRQASSISLPSLATVNGTLSFIENTVETIATPNLTSTTGLTLVGNTAITNFTANSLTTIGGGGLLIANNSDLITINGFEKLKTISGALDVTGNFSTAEIPDLAQVGGAFNMESSGNFSCTPFDKLNDESEILSTKYTCTFNSNNVQTGNSTSSSGSGSGTSTGSSSSSTSTKKSAAGQLDAPMAMGLVGGFLAMLL